MNVFLIIIASIVYIILGQGCLIVYMYSHLNFGSLIQKIVNPLQKKKQFKYPVLKQKRILILTIGALTGIIFLICFTILSWLIVIFKTAFKILIIISLIAILLFLGFLIFIKFLFFGELFRRIGIKI